MHVKIFSATAGTPEEAAALVEEQVSAYLTEWPGIVIVDMKPTQVVIAGQYQYHNKYNYTMALTVSAQ